MLIVRCVVTSDDGVVTDSISFKSQKGSLFGDLQSIGDLIFRECEAAPSLTNVYF